MNEPKAATMYSSIAGLGWKCIFVDEYGSRLLVFGVERPHGEQLVLPTRGETRIFAADIRSREFDFFYDFEPAGDAFTDLQPISLCALTAFTATDDSNILRIYERMRESKLPASAGSGATAAGALKLVARIELMPLRQ